MEKNKKKVKKSTKKASTRKWTIKNKISKKDIVTIGIILAVFILAVVGIVCLIKNIVITSKYSYYTEKMNWYGYNKLYDNESAKSTEKVYSDEIAKMVVGVLYNKTDKNFAQSRIYDTDESEISTNESWVVFAKSIPILTAKDIKMGENTSKFQVAKMLIEGIEYVYKKDIEITESLDEKYRKNYTEEELKFIDKAISIGILKNSNKDVQKRGMLKGELNQMLITALEKYATVYYKNMYSRSSDVSLVKDKEKMPSNSSKYPYITDNISKEIYEIEMPEMLSSISETPKQVYDVYHDEYYNTEENIVDYFDAVLNVDYRTISVDDFIHKLNTNVVYNLYSNYSDESSYKGDIEKYVKYVKDNNIILTGSATPLLPIIYSNGMLHYVRCKIDFKVVNSKTNENLLFWDNGVTYNSNDISVYVDIAVTPTMHSKAFRIFNGVGTMSYICKDDNNLVTVK